MNAAVVVVTAAAPWWQVLIQVLVPLVAIGIAVGSAMRDNKLRRAAAAAGDAREKELALVRARRILDRCAGSTISGGGSSPQQSTIIWIQNTNDAPIYDVQLTGAMMEGAPMDAEWRPTQPASGLIQHIGAGEEADVTGYWWRPGPAGHLETGPLSSGNPAAVHPIVSWHDENGRRFAKNGTGTVAAVPEP